MADKNGHKISWKTLERRHCGATESYTDKDSKSQRQLEDFGRGMLPAVEGHSLEQNRITLHYITRYADMIELITRKDARVSNLKLQFLVI